MSQEIDRSIAQKINDRARSRAIRDLIEWYPEDYQELRSKYLAEIRIELGYQDARVVRGAKAGISNVAISRARAAAIKEMTARHRLEFDLLRDAHRRELQEEAGYIDGRKTRNRRKR